MTEIMAVLTGFFFAHSVAICVVLGVLLVVSTIVFLKVMSKHKKLIAEKKNDPKLHELEKMYLESFKN